MSNMLEFAKHIIAVANNNSYGITNLQLQKVMYFTITDGLSSGKIDKKFVESFYDEKFEAQVYGPVVPTINNKFKHYGPTYIIKDYKLNNNFKTLNSIIKDLLEIMVFDLVEESYTHKIWKENKDIIKQKRTNTGIKYEIDNLISCL